MGSTKQKTDHVMFALSRTKMCSNGSWESGMCLLDFISAPLIDAGDACEITDSEGRLDSSSLRNTPEIERRNEKKAVPLLLLSASLYSRWAEPRSWNKKEICETENGLRMTSWMRPDFPNKTV